MSDRNTSGTEEEQAGIYYHHGMYWIYLLEGTYFDVINAQKSGVRTPPEYWSRVRGEIRELLEPLPEKLPSLDNQIKITWKRMAGFGKSPVELWEFMEKQDFDLFLEPLIFRWLMLGYIKTSRSDANVLNFLIHTSMKQLLENRKKRKSSDCDCPPEALETKSSDVFKKVLKILTPKLYRAIAFPAIATATLTRTAVHEHLFHFHRQLTSGKVVKMVPLYYYQYPLGYQLFKNYNKPFDERHIYKEYDFCS